MAGKLSSVSRLFVAIAGCLIAMSLFFPWWGMNFTAPQYPEGLDIIVYPNKMEGEIEIINGLNHYIGMKPFSEESFPELQYLPFIIGIMAALAFATAAIGRKGLLYALIVLFAIGGILGIYDIHRWLTDFGTNLAPNAPITIEPFVPPVFGENTLANFVTNSYFTYGSYLIGIAFILLVLPLWKERKK
ncbi:hypothetical protein LC040_13930 [Bacillus tianshenii]|nr:hypothetical protein LC040_13930 [Bacillus tianshenii]